MCVVGVFLILAAEQWRRRKKHLLKKNEKKKKIDTMEVEKLLELHGNCEKETCVYIAQIQT